MKFCVECGNKLELRKCEGEGLIPFCNKCNEFRFPIFNTAISTAIYNKSMEKVILIQQYGKDFNILVAGYVNKGESAEEALVREVKEELNLNVINYKFVKSKYYEKSNTLMINFISFVDSEDLSDISSEVDKAQWFTIGEAKNAILKNSLAEEFLLEGINKYIEI
ncbi:MAG: NUDIX domain-containing protein [Clostridium sp.]|nr:NUDIX domain-containing protein [Clostridium sp.]